MPNACPPSAAICWASASASGLIPLITSATPKPFDAASTFFAPGSTAFFFPVARGASLPWLPMVSLFSETVSSLKRMVERAGRPAERQVVADGVDAASMSSRWPATVTSCTGWVSSPFSIHSPLAPREYSPVTMFAPWPSIAVT